MCVFLEGTVERVRLNVNEPTHSGKIMKEYSYQNQSSVNFLEWSCDAPKNDWRLLEKK